MGVNVKGAEANLWRQETPGNTGWAHSVRPGAPNKYLMISCDAHVNEPKGWAESLPPELGALLPRVEVDENGVRWDVIPGARRVRAVMHEDEGDEEDKERIKSARSPDQIIENMDRDGVDIQVSFPNKGMYVFSVGDTEKMYAMASHYNDWQAQYFGAYKDRLMPMAVILTRDIDLAVKEVERIAKMNFFRGLMLPPKPIFGPHALENLAYNDLRFDKFWARVQELNLPLTFHVGTGADPRAVTGPGSVVITRAVHAYPSTLEPIAQMCTGVIERFPKIRFATIEGGISFLPGVLEVMDETYKKHHLWIRHKLKRLPSEYFFENGFSSFEEDPVGLMVIDPRLQESHFRQLENCYMWANDYPHHEGSWPHSAQAIERQMQNLTDQQRVKILGENAVRCFGIEDLVAKRRVKS